MSVFEGDATLIEEVKNGRREGLENANLKDAKFMGINLENAMLNGANLTRANLREANLTEAHLIKAKLVRADLSISDLTRADLTRANLSKANLANADLTFADLTRAKLINADLTFADLTRANLANADLTEANLNEANLTSANLTRANLTYVDLTGADLSEADLSEADLTIANLNGAKLNGAKLNGADLTEVDLSEADLIVANLNGANLTRTNLNEADLTRADLRGADLTFADLTSANLSEANLSEADLTDANLTDANLTGANLTGAILIGANLTGAILIGAILIGANLDEAILTDVIGLNTEMPEEMPGIAYEVHNAYGKFQSKIPKYFEIINEIVDKSDETYANFENITEYIRPKLIKSINEEFPENEQKKLIDKLNAILNKFSSATEISSIKEYKIMAGKTIDFVLKQDPEFIRIYITNFIQDCYHAYEGDDGMTCSKGIVERFPMVLYTATKNACPDKENCNELFNKLNELFEPPDINEITKLWCDTYLEDAAIKSMDSDGRKEHYIKFARQKFLDAKFPVDETTEKIIQDEANGDFLTRVFKDLELGGSSKKRKTIKRKIIKRKTIKRKRKIPKKESRRKIKKGSFHRKK